MVTKGQRRAHRQKRKRRRVSAAQRREIIRLAALGKSYRQIADEVDRPFGTVARVVRPLGGAIRPEDWQSQTGRLGLEDRIEIHLGLATGRSCRAIARTLERAPSTVCRK